MRSFNTPLRLFLALLAAGGVIALASCGSDDTFGKRYAVSGTVTYNGTPLEKGRIGFFPDNPTGVGAAGDIEKGSYQLSMVGGGDGARPGKYKVVVTAKEDVTAKAKADFAKVSKNTETDRIPGQFMANAEAHAKSLIPTGYGSVTTTSLTAEVKEQSNTIDFKLSDAEAPPEPKAEPKGRGHK